MNSGGVIGLYLSTGVGRGGGVGCILPDVTMPPNKRLISGRNCDFPLGSVQSLNRFTPRSVYLKWLSCMLGGGGVLSIT